MQSIINITIRLTCHCVGLHESRLISDIIVVLQFIPSYVNCGSVLMWSLRRRQRSIDAYRSEVSCVNRLRHEIVTLRHLVSSQQETISTLTASCEQLRRDKYRIGSLLRSFFVLNAFVLVCFFRLTSIKLLADR